MILEKDEQIKDIKGYEGKYAITSHGKVYSYISNHFLKPTINRRNNKYPRLYINLGRGTENRFYIHQLVAKAFIPNPENKPEIDHIDTNALNNCINNLRWVTHEENMKNKESAEKISKNGGAFFEIENIETGEKFIGIQAAADASRVCKATVQNHLKGKVKNPKWKYTGKKITQKEYEKIKNPLDKSKNI